MSGRGVTTGLASIDSRGRKSPTASRSRHLLHSISDTDVSVKGETDVATLDLRNSRLRPYDHSAVRGPERLQAVSTGESHHSWNRRQPDACNLGITSREASQEDLNGFKGSVSIGTRATYLRSSLFI